MFADRARTLVALVAFSALAPAVASAQATARDPAAAEALYKTGRDLLAKGDWAAACPKFDSSMALDPVASTQLNIAKCHEHAGRLAQAWAAYKRALVLNQETPGAERQKTLADIAQRAIDSIEPRVPKLRLRVRESPPGLRVTRDGQELPIGTLGEAIPVDPGEHEVAARAPGFTSAPRRFTAQEGKTAEVELTLVAEASAAPNTAPSGPSPPASVGTPGPDRPAPPTESSDGGGVPTWCWVAGAAGVALIGAGVAFRIDAAGAQSNLEDACGAELACDPKGGYDPADDNARKNRGFALFLGLGGAGVVALGAAVVGAVVGSSSKPAKSASLPTPWIAPTGGGVIWTGTYRW